jgi:hypothetical protein
MCDNVCIEVHEIVENISFEVVTTVENISIEVRDFSVYNILSSNVGNSATTDENGLLFVPENDGGVSVHNDLQGLNDGDFKHLTAIEKSKFDSIPNSFALVATSNDYNDLDNLPTIPTKTSDLINDGSDGVNPFITAQDLPTQYTDEQAQDAVGNILIDSSEIDFSYNDTTPSITASLKNNSISNQRLEHISANHLKGRLNGNGVVQDIAMSDLPISTATQTALNSKLDKFLELNSISILSSGWLLSGGIYEYQYTNINITESSIVDVIPDNSSYSIVSAAQILPRVDTFNGSLKIYSNNLPSGNFNVTIIINRN